MTGIEVLWEAKCPVQLYTLGGNCGIPNDASCSIYKEILLLGIAIHVSWNLKDWETPGRPLQLIRRGTRTSWSRIPRNRFCPVLIGVSERSVVTTLLGISMWWLGPKPRCRIPIKIFFQQPPNNRLGSNKIFSWRIGGRSSWDHRELQSLWFNARVRYVNKRWPWVRFPVLSKFFWPNSVMYTFFWTSYSFTYLAVMRISLVQISLCNFSYLFIYCRHIRFQGNMTSLFLFSI